MTEQYSDIVKFIKHKLRGGLAWKNVLGLRLLKFEF